MLVAEDEKGVRSVVERVLRAKGVASLMEAITLEEIAREADVTVPTIIRRFGGKERLYAAVLVESIIVPWRLRLTR
mgnify:CR=1 FL=1